MRLVKRGTPSHDLETLSAFQESSVMAYFGRGHATEAEQRCAEKLARRARSLNAWFLCDCRQDKPALLFPRQVESGAITLVRPAPPRQSPHAKTCPFYLQESVPSERPPSPSRGVFEDFCLLKPQSEHSTQQRDPDTQYHQTQSSTREPALTRLMLMLLDRAGMSRIDTENFPALKRVGESIKSLAKTLPMWPKSKLMLNDVLVTHPRGRFALFKNLRNEQRFGDRRRQCYLISLLSDWQEIRLTCLSGDVIDVVGSVHGPSRTPKGPYWAMILFGEERPGSGFFSPLRASIWPAYSNKLVFPVDSEPERETLRHLTSWRIYWQERDDLQLSITKPLDLTQGIRPDFIVGDEETGKQVVVETMGSKSDDYLARKARTHAEMAAIGPIVEHHPGDDALAFKQAVSKALFGWGR